MSTSTQTITQSQLRNRHNKGNVEDDYSSGRVPTAIPKFTVGDIRRAIPAHCFERSLIKSYSYVVMDILLICVAVYLSLHINQFFTTERFGNLAGILRTCSWVLYWIACGSFATGLWVLGHECGHGGFANSAVGNDIPGFILHTFLLVPYYAWKISHRKHHSNTGNLDADEVFVPSIDRSSTAKPVLTEEDSSEPAELSINYTIESINRFVNIVKMLTIGWPAYLLYNVTAHGNYPQDKWVNHFDPYSPIFLPQDKNYIILSDLGLLGMFTALGYFIYQYSFSTVFCLYFGPYLIVNLFLVLITFLQHTDLRLPHYAGSEWDWLRGALATVDRDYWIWNMLLHHITDTHVVHHLFSSMPHYHAQEATKYAKPLLGDYYLYDPTPVPIALWKIFGRCHAVKPEKNNPGILWF